MVGEGDVENSVGAANSKVIFQCLYSLHIGKKHFLKSEVYWDSTVTMTQLFVNYFFFILTAHCSYVKRLPCLYIKVWN